MISLLIIVFSQKMSSSINYFFYTACKCKFHIYRWRRWWRRRAKGKCSIISDCSLLLHDRATFENYFASLRFYHKLISTRFFSEGFVAYSVSSYFVLLSPQVVMNLRNSFFYNFEKFLGLIGRYRSTTNTEHWYPDTLSVPRWSTQLQQLCCEELNTPSDPLFRPPLSLSLRT